MKKFIFGVIIVFFAYYFDFIKLPKSCNDIRQGNVEFNDPCIKKEIDGNYSLSILFINSSNRVFQKQKMELYYDLNLQKIGCEIHGIGTKRGYSIIDTLTFKRSPIIKDEKEVEVTGEIVNDTLGLKVFFKTESNNDCKVDLKFPFSGRTIKIIEGTFFEKCGLSTGTAKLKKKEN